MSEGSDPEAKAEGLGMIVRYPKADEIFVDIDSEADLAAYEASLTILQRDMGLEETERRPSATPGHWHIVCRVVGVKLEPLERVCYQAVLGSDRLREALAIRQINLGRAGDASCFFEPPPVEVDHE